MTADCDPGVVNIRGSYFFPVPLAQATLSPVEVTVSDWNVTVTVTASAHPHPNPHPNPNPNPGADVNIGIGAGGEGGGEAGGEGAGGERAGVVGVVSFTVSVNTSAPYTFFSSKLPGTFSDNALMLRPGINP